MTAHFRIVMLSGALALTTAALQASAQDDLGTYVSGGYQNVQGTMHGWYAQINTEMTRRFGLVFQADGSYGRDCRDCEPEYHDYAFLGGPRFTYTMTPRVSLYWHSLFGLLRSVAQPYLYDQEWLVDEDVVNYLALQPGAGVTVMLNPRFGIRAQGDLQFAIPDQNYEGMLALFPRAAVGAVVRIGAVP